jgi:hypothetical protein
MRYAPKWEQQEYEWMNEIRRIAKNAFGKYMWVFRLLPFWLWHWHRWTHCLIFRAEEHRVIMLSRYKMRSQEGFSYRFTGYPQSTHFETEDGGRKFFRNFAVHLQCHMILQRRRPQYEHSQSWVLKNYFVRILQTGVKSMSLRVSGNGSENSYSVLVTIF